jgi:hypothetical protein
VLPGSVWIGAAERSGIVTPLAMAIPEMAAVIVTIKALGHYVAAADAVGRNPQHHQPAAYSELC